MFTTFVLVLHIFICVMLIGIILLQQGKGADAGVAFGGGGGNTLFGAGGADNFLVRLTTVGAVMFFITSLTLAIYGNTASESTESLFRDAPASSTPVAPAPSATVQPAGTAPASVPSGSVPSAAESAPAGNDLSANDLSAGSSSTPNATTALPAKNLNADAPAGSNQ